MLGALGSCLLWLGVGALAPRHLYASHLPPAFTVAAQLYSAPAFTYLAPSNLPLTAVVEIRSYGDVEGSDDVKGRILFVQPHPPASHVFMSGNLTGLSPGKHGIHIHEFGDTASGCASFGKHYNPAMLNHGGPTDPYRHLGDLGNIEAKEDGTARLEESDHVITLSGPQSILGRGLVIHAKADDLGRGGDQESLRTGNAGGRVACGVIAWADPIPPK